MGHEQEGDNEFLSEIRSGFLQEAVDAISAVEGSFLSLEKDPTNSKEFGQILRLFHNLKGSAAAVGFTDLSGLCHKIENLLVKVKEKKLDLTDRVFELLLHCTDRVNQGIAALSQNHSASLDFSSSIKEIEKILEGGEEQPLIPKSSESNLFKDALDLVPALLVLADSSNLDATETLAAQIQVLQNNIPEKTTLNSEIFEKALAHLKNVLNKKMANKSLI